MFCKFHSDDGRIDKNLEFNENSTIRDVLVSFLEQTNSKINYNVEEISFMYNSILINSEKYLDRPIKVVFKRNNNPKIKVIDSNNIIGGKERFLFWIINIKQLKVMIA